MSRSRKVVVGMKLVCAPGSPEMQRALVNPHVHAIVDGMLHTKGSLAFQRIAQFLRAQGQKEGRQFANKLAALRINLSARPDGLGKRVLTPALEALMIAIEALYDADQETVNYCRGAIVELLAGKVVQGRCLPNEYFSNHKIVDGSYHTDQIDIIVHTPQNRHCEAYSCKMSPNKIACADCTDLSRLVECLDTYQYDTHIGTICFEHSKQVEIRIQAVMSGIRYRSLPIAYGLDNFFDLEKNPFAL